MKVSLHGILLVSVLVWTALVGAIGLIGPSLVLLALPFESSRRAYRWWSSYIARNWFALSTLLLEKWAKVKVVISGDVLPRGEPAMIISNHRTRIDWMFMWCLCLRLGILDSMKITLKDSLKGLPGFGWAMQAFLFVFLARDKGKDLQHMEELLSYHTSNAHPLSLILFPEGTDLSPENLARSNDYAAQQGLVKYRHVLHPKVVGWSRSVALLRGTCANVYDCTIGYRDFEGERPSEASLISARYPREVHIHIERHSMESLPEAPAELEQWCRNSFRAKEKRLQAFYSSKHTTFGPPVECPVAKDEIISTWAWATLFWMAASLASWSSLVLLFGWIITFLVSFVWILLTRAGGVDILELRLHGRGGAYPRMFSRFKALMGENVNGAHRLHS